MIASNTGLFFNFILFLSIPHINMYITNMQNSFVHFVVIL